MTDSKSSAVAVRPETALKLLMEAASPQAVDERVRCSLRDSGILIETRQGVTVWDETADADHGRALRALDASLTAAPDASIIRWLTALWGASASRNRDALDLDVVMELYVPRLAEFPADVVKHLCLKHRWKWFPEIAALEDEADKMSAPRRVSKMIVTRRAAGKDVFGIRRGGGVDAESKPADAGKRAEIAARMAEIFPTKRSDAG